MSERTLKVATNSNLFCKVSLIVAAILLVVIAIGGVAGTKYLREHEKSNVLTEAQTDVSTLTVTILEELETPADVIRVLAENTWVPAALVTGSEEDIERVNSLLDRYKKEFRVSVCYLMDITGTTIASSNRNTKTSFVGKNYSFRPYFKQAIDGKQGAYFALGVTSFKRGYYSSFPIRNGTGRIVGAAVIKKELDEAEEVFRNYKNSFFVSPEGVIFLSGDPAVLFRSLWFLSDKDTGAAFKVEAVRRWTVQKYFPQEDINRGGDKLRKKTLYGCRQGSHWGLESRDPETGREHFLLHALRGLVDRFSSSSGLLFCDLYKAYGPVSHPTAGKRQKTFTDSCWKRSTSVCD